MLEYKDKLKRSKIFTLTANGILQIFASNAKQKSKETRCEICLLKLKLYNLVKVIRNLTKNIPRYIFYDYRLINEKFIIQ